MGSHLGAIGMPTGDNFADVIRRLLSSAAHLGSTPDGRVDVYAHQDASGSRATVTLEERRVTCFTPTFRPATQLTVSVGELADDDCPYERPLMVEVLDEEGDMVYPLAVAIEDLGISVLSVPTGRRSTLEVVAIAERFDLHTDEAPYRATGTPMAVESLIPSGLFAPGGAEPEGFQVRPVMLMSGTVVAAELQRHSLFEKPFAVLRVASLGAEYVACLDVGDLGGPADPQLPAVGSIISGQFYLSGRLLADASPAT